MQVLRQMVDVTRRLLRGETVDFSGEFKLSGAQLHFPCRSSIPIYFACSGPKMLSLAGEIADGVIAQCGLFPAAIDFARHHIAEGARKAGRSPAEIDLWIMACGAIDEEPGRGIEKCRTMAAWFAQTARHCCQLAGIDPALVERIQQAYRGGEFHQAQAAARLVPDDMVELFTLGGNPDQVQARLTRLAAHGVTAVNFMPIGAERTRSIELFADLMDREFRRQQ
jgi:5,10-methylenetetrahydromethanopterin reductase